MENSKSINENSFNNWFERSDLAAEYAKYRPRYERSMYEDIIKFCKQNEGFKTQVAVDVGCGSGQSTFPLADCFDKIYGVDISEAQLKWARENNTFNNIEFRQGPAEDLSFIETGSVDLVLTGTAIHWFDHEKFFKEVQRILKPDTGHVAVYIYTPGYLDDNIGRSMTKKFFHETLKAEDLAKDRFGDYTVTQAPEDGLVLPFDEVKHFKDVTLRKKMTVHSYIEFIGTLSDYNCSIGTIWTRDEAEEKRRLFEREMEELYKDWPNRTEETNEPIVNVLFPIHLQVGRMKAVQK